MTDVEWEDSRVAAYDRYQGWAEEFALQEIERQLRAGKSESGGRADRGFKTSSLAARRRMWVVGGAILAVALAAAIFVHGA